MVVGVMGGVCQFIVGCILGRHGVGILPESVPMDRSLIVSAHTTTRRIERTHIRIHTYQLHACV